MIVRNIYEQKITYLLGKPGIKVITGQRRSGKSILLRQLVAKFPDTSLYLDMEHIDTLLDVRTAGFAEYLGTYLHADITMLAVDEIQKIPAREEVLVGFHNKYPALEIWITGSNSTLLSNDLTTLLRGRYIELHIHPFGYDEFCDFFGYTKHAESFLSYIQYGGFPSIYIYKDDTHRFQEHARLLIDSIFVRDIAERYEVQDMNLLSTLFLYIVSTAGNIFSYTAFVDRYAVLQKSSYTTVIQYLSYLESSFMIYGVDIYNLQGKNIIQRQKKYYLSDHSWRKILFSQYDLGAGKELENVLYIEALRQGRSVYIGKIAKKEVDFILEKGNKKIYVQVCYILTNEEVIQREFQPLEAIDDNFPKYVVSLDPILHINPKGIQHIQFWNMEKVFA